MIDEDTPGDVRNFVLEELVSFNEYVLFRPFERVDLDENSSSEPPEPYISDEYLHVRAEELKDLGKFGKSSVLVYDRHFTQYGVKVYVISWWQKFVLKVSGKVFVFYARKPGWSGKLPFYIAKCGRCGRHFIDYPRSFSEHLDCPKCNVS